VELYRDHLSFLSQAERNEILWKTVQRVWPFGLSLWHNAKQRHQGA
jgi:hypothetical protein